MAAKMTIQLESCKAETQRLEIQLQAKQLELDRSVSFQKTTEQRCLLLQGELKELHQGIDGTKDAYHKQNHDLTSEIDFLRSQRTALEDKLTSMEEDMVAKDATITTLQDMMFKDKQKFRNDLDGSKNNAKKLCKEITALRSSLLQNETETAVIKSLHRESDSNMAAMETATLENKKQVGVIQEESKKMEQEMEKLREENKELHRKFDESATKVEHHNMEKVKVEQKLTLVEDELNLAKTKLPTAQEELADSLMKTFDLYDASLEEDPLTSALEEVRVVHQKMFLSDQAHSDKLIENDKRVKEKNEQLRLLKASLFQKEAELSSLKSISQSSDDTILGFEMASNKVEEEIQSRIQEANLRVEEAVAEAKARTDEVQKMKDESNKARKEFDDQIGRNQEKLSSSQSEVMVLGEMMDAANKIVAKLTTQVRMYERQHTNEANSSDESESDTASELDTSIKLNKDVDTPWTFERRLLKERKQHLKEIDGLNVEIRESKVALCELAYKKESLEAVMHLLREEINVLRKQVATGVRTKALKLPTPIEQFLSELDEAEKTVKARVLGRTAIAPDLRSFFLGKLGMKKVKGNELPSGQSAKEYWMQALGSAMLFGSLKEKFGQEASEGKDSGVDFDGDLDDSVLDNTDASEAVYVGSNSNENYNDTLTSMHGFAYEEGIHGVRTAETTPLRDTGVESLAYVGPTRKLNFAPVEQMDDIYAEMRAPKTPPKSKSKPKNPWTHVKSTINSNAKTINNSSNISSSTTSKKPPTKVFTQRTIPRQPKPTVRSSTPPPDTRDHLGQATVVQLDGPSPVPVAQSVKKEAIPSWKLAHQAQLKAERELRKKNRVSWTKRKDLREMEIRTKKQPHSGVHATLEFPKTSRNHTVTVL